MTRAPHGHSQPASETPASKNPACPSALPERVVGEEGVAPLSACSLSLLLPSLYPVAWLFGSSWMCVGFLAVGCTGAAVESGSMMRGDPEGIPSCEIQRLRSGWRGIGERAIAFRTLFFSTFTLCKRSCRKSGSAYAVQSLFLKVWSVERAIIYCTTDSALPFVSSEASG